MTPIESAVGLFALLLTLYLFVVWLHVLDFEPGSQEGRTFLYRFFYPACLATPYVWWLFCFLVTYDEAPPWSLLPRYGF